MRKQQKQREEKIMALYARLSKDDEREGTSGSIENQRIILERYAKENHLPNPRFFADDGYSGVSFTRPAFMEIMELAEQGKIGIIVTKDHSRLGRNRLIVGQLLEEDFVRLGVRYIAIMENIDTAKGVSDIVPMQDLFNEWHAKNTSDKVKKAEAVPMFLLQFICPTVTKNLRKIRPVGRLMNRQQKWCGRFSKCV